MYLPILKPEQIAQKIDHFSASQINMIMGCKFKWASRYLYKLPSFRKRSQMLDVGCFFHDEVKFASTEGSKRFDPNGMLERMKKKCEETKTLTYDEFPAIIDLFLKTYGSYEFNNENTEVMVGGMIPQCKLRCTGFVDHVMEKDGKKKIIDLKIKGTVSKNKEGEILYSDSERIQQALYSHFLKIPDTELHILNINRRRKTDKFNFFIAKKTYTDEELDRIMSMVRMHIREMYSNIYPPNRGYAFCSFDMCEYWGPCHDIWG